ncbi:hypothetical protein M413DRAFT_29542 [Hebeloma cylindrosporum]|uniref:Uncharacterized protein n=1 Tax=Hebeloma cylindrosporum TaxID=76867 RepID=A0A0C2XP02_HEBCY|nr:hypothetical protein M413DRAFT_29542 [Hebeloma cylindrosporum h7]
MDLLADFGGPYPLGWNTLKNSVVDPFMEANPQGNDHRLTINWFPSSYAADPKAWAGRRTFKLLFRKLSEAIAPGQTALAFFERISISVSELYVEMNVPFNGLERTAEEKAKIDRKRINLGSASNLRELVLLGSHLYFSERFSNVPFHRLTLLCVSSSCRISVNDTLVLIHSCPLLRDATFGDVDTEARCELHSRYQPLPAGANFTSQLETFTITSYIDISRVLTSLHWLHGNPTITINILDDALAGQDWGPSFVNIPISTNLIMNGNFPQATMAMIRQQVPGVNFGR